MPSACAAVEPGKFYRCGQLTQEGFREAVRELGIRTIINVQDDVPDPNVWHTYLDRDTCKESEVCKELGVHASGSRRTCSRQVKSKAPTAGDR